ncbi:MAG: flagellar biosynthetic protein FliO [Alphaproteobacteria bacterium]
MDPADYAQFVLALIFVLGLIGLAALMLRRFGPGALSLSRNRTGARRLSVVEALPIDPRRRLLLIRRDGVEHLLLLGPNGDRIVESDIEAPEETEAETHPATVGVAQRFDAVVRQIRRKPLAKDERREA